MLEERDKVRISITLKGEQAERFDALARAKYGNNKHRRAKLLRLAAEAILGSWGMVVFPPQQAARIRRIKTKTTEILETEISQPPWIPDDPVDPIQASTVNAVTKELKTGNSKGAELFKKFRERVEKCE